MDTRELSVSTGRGRGLIDLTGALADFLRETAAGADGLLHVFAPHATAGLVVTELGSGSDADIMDALDRLLPRDDRWHALARLAVRDDVYSSLRLLTMDVLAVGEPHETGEQKIDEWQHTNSSRLQRARRTLAAIYADEERDLATLSVAARQIRNMTRTSGMGTNG